MINETITVINKLGLHARASAKLVMLAANFNCEIKISKDGKWANAKSLMGIMMLSVRCGNIITIEADGDDEGKALQEIEQLFNNKFGEVE
ncbi:MAG: HPr family phosphocarrier protein [Burkholderiales bacterium]|nr:HPr family phosphocarrier protein [Burkholderiales bacterium]